MPSRGLLETYQNMRSHTRDHSSTQTKSHIDPCRNYRHDGQTQTAFQLYTLALALYIAPFANNSTTAFFVGLIEWLEKGIVYHIYVLNLFRNIQGLYL